MPTPPPPPDESPTDDSQEGYGDMTKAWLDAGAQVAEYEAARNAEKRRMIMGVAGIVFGLGVLFALVAFVF